MSVDKRLNLFDTNICCILSEALEPTQSFPRYNYKYYLVHLVSNKEHILRYYSQVKHIVPSFNGIVSKGSDEGEAETEADINNLQYSHELHSDFNSDEMSKIRWIHYYSYHKAPSGSGPFSI